MFASGNPRSFTAAEAIPAYRFVVIDNAGKVALAGADADAIGVSLEAASADGDVIAIAMIDGSTIVEVAAHAAIAIGAAIGTAAAGRAVTAATGVMKLGTALQAAGAQDEYISVLLQKRASDNP